MYEKIDNIVKKTKCKEINDFKYVPPAARYP